MATNEELRELEKAATPGPWRHHHGKLRERFPTIIDEIQQARSRTVIIAWGGFDPLPPSARRKNATLIVAMRNELPRLLDDVDRLTKERDRLQAQFTEWRHCPNSESMCEVTECEGVATWARYITVNGLEIEQAICATHYHQALAADDHAAKEGD